MASGSYHFRENYFFIVVVIVFCLMTHPSAPLASEKSQLYICHLCWPLWGPPLQAEEMLVLQEELAGKVWATTVSLGELLSRGRKSWVSIARAVPQAGVLPERGEESQQTHGLPYMVSPIETKPCIALLGGPFPSANGSINSHCPHKFPIADSLLELSHNYVLSAVTS